MKDFTSLIASAATIVFATHAHVAIAQDAAPAALSTTQSATMADASTEGALETPQDDIIVTAQKRSQSINSVGLTITAASAIQLAQRGITDTTQLDKLVPGFNFTRSPAATPVYTLRGIGLYDFSFGAASPVAIYVDEVDFPAPFMSTGAALDVERVEVLKGPQGTLFGQSSTGGAINYISAKPTRDLSIGGMLTVERFGRVSLESYLSGPITPTLRTRFAVRATGGGAWQQSVSRRGDDNGSANLLIGRWLTEWEPSDRFRASLNVSGWRDRSELQVAQFVYNTLSVTGAPDPRNPAAIVDPVAFAGVTTPTSPNYDASFAGAQNLVFNRAAAGDAGAQAYLVGPGPLGNSIRKADWTANWSQKARDHDYSVALRGEYDISEEVTFTSLTAFQKARVNRSFDGEGTVAAAEDKRLFGSVRSFSQEARLSGRVGELIWIVGGNYDRTRAEDNLLINLTDNSINEALPGLRFDGTTGRLDQTIRNLSGFANGEFEVTDRLTLNGGARYTSSKRNGLQCSFDSGNGALAATFGNSAVVPGFGFYDLQTAFGLSPAGHRVVGPGQCYGLNNTVSASSPSYLRPTLTPFPVSLNEDNVSFRAGMNYKIAEGGLLYTTVSRGYKAGILSNISASVTRQYVPAKQERVLAYEAGIKLPLFDRVAQFNAAAFYYDYADKQVRARVNDPIFGLLETLVNVPKSRVTGVEGELTARPFIGLALTLSATYLSSEVTKPFSTAGAQAVYNQQGYTGDFKGSPLPYTPKFSGVADAQYTFAVGDGVEAFFGGSGNYTSRDNTTFHNDTLRADDFFRRRHLLIDLRAGLSDPKGDWNAMLFARNVTNKFYEASIFTGADVIYRFPGLPATYGVTLIFKH